MLVPRIRFNSITSYGRIGKVIPVIYCLAAISGTNACVPFDLARKYQCRQTRTSLELCGRSKTFQNETKKYLSAIQNHDKYARSVRQTFESQQTICSSYVYVGSATASNEMIIYHVWITKESQATNLKPHLINNKREGEAKKAIRIMQMKMHLFQTNRLWFN